MSSDYRNHHVFALADGSGAWLEEENADLAAAFHRERVRRSKKKIAGAGVLRARKPGEAVVNEPAGADLRKGAA